MKKLLVLVSLISLLLTGVSYAEISATAYTGSSLIDTREQTVFINAYNNSSTNFLGTSHSVVILDTSYTTSGRASNAVGTYFTTTTTADDETVLGITDGVINAGAVGRIIVRGTSKVELLATPSSAWAAGATIATSTTAGQATKAGETDGTMPGFVIGTLLAPSNDVSSARSVDTTDPEGTTTNNIWWAWIGKE